MEDVETQAKARYTRQPTRETTERETLRCDASGNFMGASTRSGAEDQAQRDAPLQVGNRRCGCRSRSHSDQLRFVGIGMRWRAVLVIVRFFCHGPYQRALLSLLWREEFIAGMECRCLRHGIAEVVVAVGTQQTPTSRPRLIFAAEVRGGARNLPILPKTVVATPCSSRCRRTSRQAQSGPALRSPAPGCSS